MADNGSTVRPTGPGDFGAEPDVAPPEAPGAGSGSGTEPEPEPAGVVGSAPEPDVPATPDGPAVAAAPAVPGARVTAHVDRLRAAASARFSRPVIVSSAAVAGAILIAVPFLIAGPKGDPTQHHAGGGGTGTGVAGGAGGPQAGFAPDLAGAPSSEPSDGRGRGRATGKRSGDSRQALADPALPYGAPGSVVPDGPGVGSTGGGDTAPGGGSASGGGDPAPDDGSAPGGGDKAGGSTGGGDPHPAKTPSAAAEPAAPAAYNAVTGPGCSTWGYQQTGYYTKGTEGWRAGSGAWAHDGCKGTYDAVPLNGNAEASPTQYTEWLFSPQLTASASCTVLVYIPPSSDLTMVGGNPAFYTVYRAFTPIAKNVIATFKISQVSHRGQWVKAGTYPGSAKLAVGLDNRGVDWGKGNEGRHVAAAQVRTVCEK